MYVVCCVLSLGMYVYNDVFGSWYMRGFNFLKEIFYKMRVVILVELLVDFVIE